MISLGTGIRVQAFRDAVRSRDKRCVITGVEATEAEDGEWTGFEAAHIFPLAYEQQWSSQNFARWISVIPSNGGTINSVQNGLLLLSSIHQLFDTYAFSIDPDVCVYTLYLYKANSCYRITIRLFALQEETCLELLANVLINSFSMTPKDQPSSFFAGTSDKLFLSI